MNDDEAPPSINIAAIRVAGVGGLGMVAMAGVIAAALPAARFLLIASFLGGLLLAVALVALRRHQQAGTPYSDGPHGLFPAPPRRADEPNEQNAHRGVSGSREHIGSRERRAVTLPAS